MFDGLNAGTYFVRVTQIPEGYTFTDDLAVGSNQADDSNVNGSGVSALFTLGVNEPNVRPVVASDGDLVASWIDPTIDAGIVAPDVEVLPTTDTQPVPPTAPAPTTPAPVPAPLPATGVDAGGQLWIAMLLLLAGGAMVLIGRRRKESRH